MRSIVASSAWSFPSFLMLEFNSTSGVPVPK